jgi:AraC-like DNA-binding protein
VKGIMAAVIFSSTELDAQLDERKRFSLWRDIYTSRYSEADISYLTEQPFLARSRFSEFGNVGLAQFRGTVNRYRRTSQHLAADTRGAFLLGFNCSRGTMRHRQIGREIDSGPGSGLFFTHSEPSETSFSQENAWIGIYLPQTAVLELVADADNIVCAGLDPARPAVRHLRRYMGFLARQDDAGDDLALRARIGAMTIDLAALALGATKDAAEIAQMRGLRAARVQEILALVKAGFASPSFSARDVAVAIGLSPRYVQDLLQETGRSFTERVLELRLQKALAMLTDRRHDRLRISEIAYACGFGEVSYFNQVFRRRFGLSPTQARGTA